MLLFFLSDECTVLYSLLLICAHVYTYMYTYTCIFTYECHLIFDQQTCRRLLLLGSMKKCLYVVHFLVSSHSRLTINMKTNLFSWICAARGWSLLLLGCSNSRSNQPIGNHSLSTCRCWNNNIALINERSRRCLRKLIMYVTFCLSLSWCWTCPKGDENIARKRYLYRW